MPLPSFAAPTLLRPSKLWFTPIQTTCSQMRRPGVIRSSATVQPAPVAHIETAQTSSTRAEKAIFQCPSCKTPYPPIPPQQLSDLPANCPNCNTPVQQKSGYVDMTPEAAATTSVLRNWFRQPQKQALFQLPTVSFAYERGWRNNFKRAGFPGIDREFALFLDHVLPAESVLDMSCGSGLMSRRLASSGHFSRVIAADYSDAMLRETVSRAKSDTTVPEFDVVRADVAALPFTDGAFDAVHAGAALHCWPNVQDGLGEVRRVLRPGGKFFATTFMRLAYVPNREALVARPALYRAVKRAEELFPGEVPYRFFEKDELEFLFRAAGFASVEVQVLKGCAIIRCEAPAEWA